MPAKARQMRKTRLDAAFARAESAVKASNYEAELQSDLAQHLCVLLSGFVESAVEDIVSDYAIAKGDIRLQSAITRLTDRFQNPKSNTVLDLLGNFDLQWRRRLQDYFDQDSARADALDSIVNNKNKIAHGDASYVSYYRLRDGWYPQALAVVDQVGTICRV